MRLNLINRSTASISNVIGVGPAGPEGPAGDPGPAGAAGAPGGSDASFAAWVADTTPSATRAALNADYAAKAQPNTFTGTQKVNHGYIHIMRTDEGETSAPELHYESYRGNWISGIDVANTPKSRDFVFIARQNRLVITDGVTTSGSPTVTSASEGGFHSSWVGAAATGAGIPTSTTILSVESTTSLTLSKNATATGTSVSITFDTSGVSDIGYVKHRGMQPVTVGIGVTPPDGTHRLQVTGSQNDLAMGGLRLLSQAGQTGKALTVADSGNTARLWVDADGVLGGANATFGSAVAIRADATNNRALVFRNNADSVSHTFYYSSTSLRLRYLTGGVDVMNFPTDGSVFFYQKPSVANAGIKMRHVAGATPTGGESGDLLIGTGKIWVNDGGTWKSAALA